MTKDTEMTVSQYRALVAYLNFWTPLYPKEMGIDQAMKDIGIEIMKSSVIHQLFKAGWAYDENTGLISDTQDDDLK